MKPFRLAVVGCGTLGQRHAANAHAHPDAEVVFTFDTDRGKAQALAERVGATAAGSLEQILASDVDAVVTAVPYTLHHALATRAMRAGKHVFVEKPMTMDPGEAQEMVAVQQETGKVLLVGHILRFYPANVLIKKILDSGELGRPFNFRYRAEHHTDITKRPWMASREVGGVIVGGAIHHTDLLSWWGGPVAAVRAYGRTVMPMYRETGMHDHAVILYEFESGAVGESCYSLATHSQHLPYDEAMVSCEHGSVLLKVASGEMHLITEKPVLGYPAGHSRIQTDNDWSSGLAHEMNGFIDALKGHPPRITPREAQAAVAITLAAKRSAEAGEPGVRMRPS
jgi:predicted dehydrogenase